MAMNLIVESGISILTVKGNVAYTVEIDIPDFSEEVRSNCINLNR